MSSLGPEHTVAATTEIAVSATDSTQRNRIVIRTETDVDFLDDGFKWKVYGNKSIKNSPYRRKYFRCGEKGCTVKKRVERCCDDPRFLQTTYEGMHTHPIRSGSMTNSFADAGSSHSSSAPTNAYDLRVQVLGFDPSAEHDSRLG